MDQALGTGPAANGTVTYEVSGRVVTISINRPEKLNAMDDDVFRLLLETGRAASLDREIRAIVVRGEGRSFSAGIDLGTLARGLSDDAAPPVNIELLQEAFTVFEQAPKPVVAAVHGHCLGAGLQLALACDLRVASIDATFAAAEVRWGILPDLGATQRLPRLIGAGRAKDMILTGRSVPADEAHRWGLVNRLCEATDVRDEAMALASSLAAGPPLALASAKRLAAAAFDRSVDQGLPREANAQRVLLASYDFREAIQAGLEKREPKFESR